MQREKLGATGAVNPARTQRGGGDRSARRILGALILFASLVVMGCGGTQVAVRLQPDERRDLTLAREGTQQWIAAVPAGDVIYVVGSGSETEVTTENIHQYQEPDSPESIRSPGYLMAINAEDGSVQWTHRFNLANASQPTRGSKLIHSKGGLVFESPQTLAVLDPQNGRARWVRNNSRVRRRVIAATPRYLYTFQPPNILQVHAMRSGDLEHEHKLKAFEEVEYAWISTDLRHVVAKGIRHGAAPDASPLVMIEGLDFDPNPEKGVKAAKPASQSIDAEVFLHAPHRFLRLLRPQLQSGLVTLSVDSVKHTTTITAWSTVSTDERWSRPLDRELAEETLQRMRTARGLFFQVDTPDETVESRVNEGLPVVLGSELRAFEIKEGMALRWSLPLEVDTMVERIVDLRADHTLLQTTDGDGIERLLLVTPRGRVIWRADRLPEGYEVLDRVVSGRTLVQVIRRRDDGETALRVHTLPEMKKDTEE